MTAVGLVEILILVVAILVIAAGVVVALLRPGRRSAGDLDAGRGGTDVLAPPPESPDTTVEAPVGPTESPLPTLERPEGVAGRLVRLRERLSRSQGTLGRGLLALLSRDRVDEDTWEEI